MIEIVDYNEKWPLKYAAEANDIRNIISSNLVSIYHIGSTAIKGLKARAVIDVLIVVKKIEVIDELKKQFEKFMFVVKTNWIDIVLKRMMVVFVYMYFQLKMLKRLKNI